MRARWSAVKIAVAAALLIASATAARADTLNDADLKHKNEGGYITGLPLVAYSVDFGLGLGARVYYYWDGDRADPRFRTTPYLYRVFAQAFATSDGLQFHWLSFDAPKIMGSEYRVRTELIYMRNTISNYFGIGDRSLAPLAYPGSTTTYSSYASYTADQQRAIDGTTYARYDQYDLQRPIVLASIERLLLDDKLRLLGGFGLTYAKVHDYTGEQARWESTPIEVGRPLAKPTPIFTKLDPALGETGPEWAPVNR